MRRTTLESIARFSEGDMPRQEIKRPLVIELRQVFDTCVSFHLEKELRSARFLRGTLLRSAS